MKIVVCVKYVPDVQGERRFADRAVDRSGVDGVLNEHDEYAIEAALQLAEGSDGSVTALSMGPPQAEDAVRRALQMGADTGILVTDDALAGSDVFSTAVVLAAAIRRIGANDQVDLVLTGVSALDSLTGALPVLLAAELGASHVGRAASIEATEQTVKVRRESAESSDLIAAPLPAVASITDRANTPRYPDFKRIMAARKKPVARLSLADLGVSPSSVGWQGARVQVLSAAPSPPRTGRVLFSDDGTAATRLADFLFESGHVR